MKDEMKNLLNDWINDQKKLKDDNDDAQRKAKLDSQAIN